jgi:hypothetical protein
MKVFNEKMFASRETFKPLGQATAQHPSLPWHHNAKILTLDLRLRLVKGVQIELGTYKLLFRCPLAGR